MTRFPIDIRGARGALHDNHVLILTTNSAEKAAAEAVLTGSVTATIGRNTLGCSLSRLADRFALHMTGTSGAQADLSIGRIVRAHLAGANTPRPKLVVLLGVGWANPAFAALGDVMISTDVRALNHSRLTPGEVRRREVPRASSLGDLDDLLHHHLLADGKFVTGPLGSLEVHIADTSARDTLLAQYPTLIGGEMEAWDFVGDLGDIPWVLVKGVADFGDDDVDRVAQPGAAVAAAGLLASLVHVLHDAGLIPPARTDAATDTLLELMTGPTVRLTHGDFKGMTLNDHLNNEVMPRLLPRLRRYETDEDVAPGLAHDLAGVILELAQNAFRHGGASNFTIEFRDTSVVCMDDGQPFNIEDLVGERGGALQVRELLEVHGVDDGVRIHWKSRKQGRGNLHTIDFPRLSEDLRTAKTVCRGWIPDAALTGPIVDRVEFDPSCASVYLDVAPVVMMSRRLDLIPAIRALLQDGKGVYLACRDDRQVAFYRTRLESFVGPRLRVFVAGQE